MGISISAELQEAIRDYSLTLHTEKLVEQTRKLTCGESPYVELVLLSALGQREPDLYSLLGDRYYQGTEVRKDKEQALQIFREAAQRGSIGSNYDLAWYYFDLGEYLQAAEYFEKCVAAQDQLTPHMVSRSYGCLGACYASLSEPKYAPAFENLSIAAEKYHDSFACRRLGFLYLEKDQSHFDSAKGLHYLELGAKGGDEVAARELGGYYLFGEEPLGVQKNLKKAESILSPFADSEDSDILRYLGRIYLNGDPETGIQADAQKSLAFFERAQGTSQNPFFTADLGYAYYKLDRHEEAERMLLSAEENGYSFYSDFLGRMYRDGNLGAPDLDKALFYYGCAYEKECINNVFTCDEYAELLEQLGHYQKAYEVAGYGIKRFNDICFVFVQAKLVLQKKVPGNSAKAAEQMQQCAEFHSHAKDANEQLGAYYLSILEYRKAEKYLQDALHLGAAEAGVLMGRLYEQGGGTIAASADKAHEWFVKAAEAGSRLGSEEAACFKKGLFSGYKRVRRL